MRTKTHVKAVAIFLTIIIVTPSAFFVAPQKTNAQVGVQLVFNIPASIVDALKLAKQTISAVAAASSAASEYALVIKEYVLEPLAFILSGNAIKSITGGVIKFINGDTNGTGQSQFVQNLQGHLQGAGDSQANAFFFQFGKNSNSPFARSINSSLQSNYYQQTSLKGFFDGNQCTLGNYSPDQNAFLAGNWSQGGAAAWFALTTQDQNNPYMLHALAQRELALMVQDKTAARLQELAWGGGILSWCGGPDQVNSASDCDPNLQSCPTEAETSSCNPEIQSCAPASQTQEGAAPGDSCTKSDGTPGTIQTPGTAIKGYLDKTLGLNADKFVAMGNAAGQINSILGNVASVMDTAAFATQLIGGASINGATAGLAGASQKRSGVSYIDTYTRGAETNTAAAFNLSQGAVNKSASKLPAASTKQLLDNTKKYEAAWIIIGNAVYAASASLTTLVNSCSSVNTTLATRAQYALDNEVGLVLTQTTDAAKIITDARALVQKLEAEANSSDGSTYAADVQTLQSMPPTGEDLAYAEKESRTSATVVASTTNPFAPTDGTLVDRMNAISANANALKSSCVATLP